jgi:hypothetical protein
MKFNMASSSRKSSPRDSSTLGHAAAASTYWTGTTRSKSNAVTIPSRRP